MVLDVSVLDRDGALEFADKGIDQGFIQLALLRDPEAVVPRGHKLYEHAAEMRNKLMGPMDRNRGGRYYFSIDKVSRWAEGLLTKALAAVSPQDLRNFGIQRVSLLRSFLGGLVMQHTVLCSWLSWEISCMHVHSSGLST